jgi:GNAT superfamily N-acetyltransferase
MDFEIRTLTNADPDFYPLMGPFLSRRDIVNALSGPVWDDDGKVWLVAVEGDRVVGFCAYRVAAKVTLFCSAYVHPDRRGAGIYDALFRERLAQAGNLRPRMRATVSAYAAGTFRRYGFTAVGKRGRYTVFEKAADAEDAAAAETVAETPEAA